MYTETSDIDAGPVTRDLSAAWSQIAAIVSAVESTLGKWLTDTYVIGLTEYRAALHLSRASDRELRITELAHKVGLNMSSVTRMVGRMEAKELAFRDTCPDDARGVYAVLTDHGLDSIKKIQEPYEAKLRDLLEGAAKQYPQLELTGLDDSFSIISKLTS